MHIQAVIEKLFKNITKRKIMVEKFNLHEIFLMKFGFF